MTKSKFQCPNNFYVQKNAQKVVLDLFLHVCDDVSEHLNLFAAILGQLGYI